MNRKEMVNEITRLYTIIDEIYSERKRLNEKFENGNGNYDDALKLAVFQHFINIYEE